MTWSGETRTAVNGFYGKHVPGADGTPTAKWVSDHLTVIAPNNISQERDMSAASRLTSGIVTAVLLAMLGAPLRAQQSADTAKTKPPVNTCSGTGTGDGGWIGNPTTKRDRGTAATASAGTKLSSTLSMDGEKIALSSAETSALFERVRDIGGPCPKVPGSKSDKPTLKADALFLRVTRDTARKRPAPAVP